jgi:hypothetical protein
MEMERRAIEMERRAMEDEIQRRQAKLDRARAVLQKQQNDFLAKIQEQNSFRPALQYQSPYYRSRQKQPKLGARTVHPSRQLRACLADKSAADECSNTEDGDGDGERVYKSGNDDDESNADGDDESNADGDGGDSDDHSSDDHG